MEKIVIDLGNGLKLMAERNTEPYDKEVGIYLEKDGNYQDLVSISAGFEKDDSGDWVYARDKMVLRAYVDADSVDYTRQWIVPVIEALL